MRMNLKLSHGDRGTGRPDPNLDPLLALGAAVAFAFFVASWTPPPLAWAIFAGLLQWTAIGTAIAAALLREPVWATNLTLWDQTAVLLLLSIVANMAIDPQAVVEQLQAMQQQAPPPSAAVD